MSTFLRLITILGLLASCHLLSAQIPNAENLAKAGLLKSGNQHELNKDEINELILKDVAYSKESGMTHLYFYQSAKGIEIYDAIVSVHLDESGVIRHVSANSPESDNEIATSTENFDLQATLQSLFEFQKLKQTELKINGANERNYYHIKSPQFIGDITARKVYFLHQNELKLAWDIQFMPKSTAILKAFIIDANTGNILKEENLSNRCQFENNPNFHIPMEESTCTHRHEKKTSSTKNDGAKYRVYPLPGENPSETSQSIVENPADIIASPYGWHDTDGQDGAESNFLKGNNTEVILDRDGNFIADVSSPSGGSELNFDFEHYPSLAITDQLNQQAQLTNYFYSLNMMHDISYRLGFDEFYNFQLNHYGQNGGSDGDNIIAYAQFGMMHPIDRLFNNASFTSPADGGQGVMQLYAWNYTAVRSDFITISEPSTAIDTIRASQGNMGNGILSNPIEAELVLADDGTNASSLACQNLTQDLSNKIALVDRGFCQYGRKALNAQNAGASAVIICNYTEALPIAGPGSNGDQVTIPVFVIGNEDCKKLKSKIAEPLTLKLEAPNSQDSLMRTAELDNGVIAHEYVHGISSRLTGGASSNFCLSGRENMSEGWSDFFALALTTSEENFAEEPRAVGSYLTRENIDGKGLRTYPYSTDLSVNPLVYDDIILESRPHGVGAVWGTMLWDLHWAFVELYGFDVDLQDSEKGNVKMLKLVIEAMKLQKCNPGFVDGRDAIIMADELLHNSDHNCLIWKTFARRGLGLSADQGSYELNTDGCQAFDIPNQCNQMLSIVKQTNKTEIDPGEDFIINLSVSNYTDLAHENVNLTDLIPDGAVLDENSISVPYTYVNQMLGFNIGRLEPDSSFVISYRLVSSSDESYKSYYSYFNDWENEIDDWMSSTNDPSLTGWVWGSNTMGPLEAFSGEKYWSAMVSGTSSTQDLSSTINIPANKPVLRFHHKYLLESAADAGVIELSTDNGSTWLDMTDKFFRMPYRGGLQLPILENSENAFWGEVEEYIASYLDLSDFSDQTVDVRFRLVSGYENSTTDLLNWSIDDLAIFNLVNYNSEACVSSDQSPEHCISMSGKGIVVNPDTLLSSTDLVYDESRFRLKPNPFSGDISLSYNFNKTSDAKILVYNTSGVILDNRAVKLDRNEGQIILDYSNLKTGVYFIRILTDQGTQIIPVIKH